MKRRISILLILIVALELWLFFYWQSNKIIIHTETIKDNQMANFFDSLKVVQVSDLHIRRWGNREKELVSLIQKLNPDLIFITGDFASNNRGIDPALKVMERITQGRRVIAVLGNNDHEFRSQKLDTERLIRGLEKSGVLLLLNRSIKLKRQENSVFVIGLDDNYLWKDDLFKATDNLTSKGGKILLDHSPDIVTKVELNGINLVLSGHTHGGQVKLPLIGAIYTNRACNSVFKFVSGLYYYQNTKLYVNPGIGMSFFPVRFLCRSEITIFKFEKE
ncbi:MAG: metallophosphoesterase [candidate division Zixibacteria bacterium]|nr:metallophosphoesterase [candidate division Zixibacteria bacterium]